MDDGGLKVIDAAVSGRRYDYFSLGYAIPDSFEIFSLKFVFRKAMFIFGMFVEFSDKKKQYLEMTDKREKFFKK